MSSEISGYVDYTFELGRRGSGEGQFGNWIQYFAPSTDGRTVYCCDTSNKRIQVFDLKSRKFSHSFTTSVKGERFQARGVEVLRDGKLCVCAVGLEDESCICLFTPDGQLVSQFAQGRIGYPSAMTVDGNDCIAVYNRRSSRICRFDRDGNMIGSYLPQLQGDVLRMASEPTSNRLVIAEHQHNRVTVLDAGTGSRQLTICPQPNSGHDLLYPSGVACDRAGNMYVCDTGHNRVVKFSPIGVYQATVLNAVQNNLYHPHDMRLTSTNKLIYSHVGATYLKVFCFDPR